MGHQHNSIYFPFIADEDRLDWEAYFTKAVTQEMVQKKAFRADTQYTAKQDARVGHGTLEGNPLAGRNFSFQLSMLNGEVQPNGMGPYLAFYQSSAPSSSAIELEHPQFPPIAEGVKHAVKTKLAYLSKAVTPSPMLNMFLARGQYRHEQER